MTAGARIGAVAAALAASAALAGCGGSPDDGAKPVPATAATPITIAAPKDGQSLRAKQTSSGGLRRTTRVRGSAPAGSTVFLNATCRPKPCSAQAKAGGDGSWSASMDLTATSEAGFVSIDANAQQDVVGDGSAVATIELVGISDTPGGKRAAVASARRQAGKDPAPSTDTPASGTDSPASGTDTPPAANTPASGSLPHEVLVIGDSLAVGIESTLPAALPGWNVRTDGKIGRPLAEGMRILGAQGDAPAILAFSLFTNDDPRSTAALESAVRATATRDGGCAVWATVVRPPLNGVSYDAANTLLRKLGRELSPSLQIVDWNAAVAESPSLISSGDGVHATPQGYRTRAQLFARAIKACAGEG